jgi:hypothetical protein
MEKGLTETTSTETKQLSLLDDDISQSDYERLRAGEKVEVEVKSEPVVEKPADETQEDDSEPSQTDGDEDESDSEESEVSAKDKGGIKKPKRGFKRRIEKLNAKLSAAEAQAEHWRQQALRGQKPEERPEETPVAATAKGEPNSDDFESATEFYRAHAKWAAQEEIKAAKESERQEKLRTEAESKKTAFIGKVDAFKKAHDDFEDVIADVDDIQMSPAISQAILESDNGPELMYELAKNSEEYARMCALSPFEAVRALGRFEARLTKPSEEKKITKPKTTTKAPPPPRPISTSSANGKKSVYDEDISQSEYERIRADQEKRRNAY